MARWARRHGVVAVPSQQTGVLQRYGITRDEADRTALVVGSAGLPLCRGRLVRCLDWRPLAVLGTASYSLYLWQEVFCSNASLHLGYVLVVPALACACLSYYCVEQPMLRLRDKRREKHRCEQRPAALATQHAVVDNSQKPSFVEPT